jgi:hypothetical protein
MRDCRICTIVTAEANLCKRSLLRYIRKKYIVNVKNVSQYSSKKSTDGDELDQKSILYEIDTISFFFLFEKLLFYKKK